ncbi:hypothetical protein L486_04523 [Kwoniella mangroviensis CBS 10435]|uniref:NADH:ubiquinone oxidoreductase intermediate-associated protein 30 domain-containing protein n=1 Tax=Kwoniella mangroviensis CBS 10435 TaxID=1331196 RepID=A0A1B9ISL6_9TREE|nr:uncharacterized protein I203_06728 [Kwoniella mangroviensis CBS 8507]OCF58490.1 hypothetical protein L486_04523 [Kwoniella mangroviensis CBS 10435]OCF64144.1 hypothetical protein I203_06728 [Kwoniella mangroviensis CBS 8507]OCF78498.1 hypothetical protein I204_00438 [Kwoniella mangroviensis CBS 8886]
MSTPLKSYLGRSIDLLRRSTAKVVQSEPTPTALPSTIFSFDSSHPPVDKIDQFGLGSDIEVGGLSTCNLALIPSSSSAPSSPPPPTSNGDDEGAESSYSHMAFYGYLSTKIPQSKLGQIRTGYAGFRNISKPTLFGQDNWDLELYSHLKVKVGYRGWEGWRNRWVLNIGIDGRPKSDVFQHRLELPPTPSSSSSKIPLDPFAFPSQPTSFSTLYLPLSSFVLIKKGVISHSPIPMPKSSIRTIGFALLGRDRGDDGPSAPTQSQQGLLKSFRLGGWGKSDASEVEDDKELKALLEEDQPPTSAQAQTQIPRRSTGSPTTGYHRVGGGTTEKTPASTARNGGIDEVTSGQEEREGYFELCVKSVEAVRWDPESDEVGDV